MALSFKLDENVPGEAVALLALLKRALAVTEREPVDKRLWIVEPSRVRIRD